MKLQYKAEFGGKRFVTMLQDALTVRKIIFCPDLIISRKVVDNFFANYFN